MPLPIHALHSLNTEENLHATDRVQKTARRLFHKEDITEIELNGKLILNTARMPNTYKYTFLRTEAVTRYRQSKFESYRKDIKRTAEKHKQASRRASRVKHVRHISVRTYVHVRTLRRDLHHFRKWTNGAKLSLKSAAVCQRKKKPPCIMPSTQRSANHQRSRTRRKTGHVKSK